jgi:hypothetical protein
VSIIARMSLWGVVVVRVCDGGFDWRAAGVGAAAVIALGLTAAGVALVRARPRAGHDLFNHRRS